MAKYQVSSYPLSYGGFSSQVYAGLEQLALDGRIDLRYTLKPIHRIFERTDWGQPNNARIAYIEVARDGGDPVTVCYDMLDGAEILTINGLEKCDAYFKRSYSSRHLDLNDELALEAGNAGLLNEGLRRKIRPYGLNTPSNSPDQVATVKRILLHGHLSGELYRRPVFSLKKLVGMAVRDNPVSAIADVDPEVPSDALVLFQTRLFDPAAHYHSAETDEMNRYRAEIVKALKGSLGRKFVGGLYPDEYARRRFPDLLTDLPTDQAEYMALLTRCRIAVFSRGLRQSTGWRYPEFLRASRCIVSEPLAYELPEPLEQGVNHLTFDDPDQCVEACSKILGDEDFAARMRRANYEYYQANVKPSSIIMNTIETALSAAEG